MSDKAAKARIRVFGKARYEKELERWMERLLEHIEDLKDEIERLRGVIVETRNRPNEDEVRAILDQDKD